jgi:hypothetical protein
VGVPVEELVERDPVVVRRDPAAAQPSRKERRAGSQSAQTVDEGEKASVAGMTDRAHERARGAAEEVTTARAGVEFGDPHRGVPARCPSRTADILRRRKP